MRCSTNGTGLLAMAAVATALAFPVSLSAQSQNPDPIIVDGAVQSQPAALVKGPEIKGVITARSNERLQITTADGQSTVVTFDANTRIRPSAGPFGGRGNLEPDRPPTGLTATDTNWRT